MTQILSIIRLTMDIYGIDVFIGHLIEELPKRKLIEVAKIWPSYRGTSKKKAYRGGKDKKIKFPKKLRYKNRKLKRI